MVSSQCDRLPKESPSQSWCYSRNLCRSFKCPELRPRLLRDLKQIALSAVSVLTLLWLRRRWGGNSQLRKQTSHAHNCVDKQHVAAGGMTKHGVYAVVKLSSTEASNYVKVHQKAVEEVSI